MRLNQKSDANQSGLDEPQDPILALLEERPYSTGEMAAVLGVESELLDVALKALAQRGVVDRLLDWRWRHASMTGQALRRLARPARSRSHHVRFVTAPAVDVCTCERCDTCFQVSVGASVQFCSRCERDDAERLPLMPAPAAPPPSKTRVINGVEFDVVFDGRGETPQWPTAWSSPLTGGAILRL
jgi:hypothetical protein